MSLQWKKVVNPSKSTSRPKPRHGHRAVNINELIIIYGGGNEGIIDELHVFNTATNLWYVPHIKGDRPPGRASHGFVVDGMSIFVFGGMVEFGKYSNELYELQTTEWEWRKLYPEPPEDGSLPPCPRIGHSFTMVGDNIYLFGGLANESDDPENNIPKYLNDLYILKIEPAFSKWEMPLTFGENPSPRESHTAVSYQYKQTGKLSLIIYGGMNGCRLDDLWLLDTDTMMWTRSRTRGTTPLPRSLHSSTVIGHRMYVFGGWVPIATHDSVQKREWKCTNSLACLNLETMTWEDLVINSAHEHVPRPRAGHCTVGIHTRLYVWSGRYGYRKAWNNQVCCKDFWYLEVCLPPIVKGIILSKTSTQSLRIRWAQTLASAYILEIQKIENIPETKQKVAPVVVATSSVPVTIGSTTANEIQKIENIPETKQKVAPVVVATSSVPVTIDSTTANEIQKIENIPETKQKVVPVVVATSSVPVTIGSTTANSNAMRSIKVVRGSTHPLTASVSSSSTALATSAATISSVVTTSALDTTATIQNKSIKPILESGAATVAGTGSQPTSVPVVIGAVGSGDTSIVRVLTDAQTVRLSTTRAPKTAIIGSGTQQTTQIITGTNLATAQIQKPASTGIVTGNLFKLSTPSAVGGNMIFVNSPNIVQVGTAVTKTTGNPLFVITNNQGQQLHSNQKINIITTGGNLRAVQTGGIVTSAGNNLVSLVASSQVNTITTATMFGTSTAASVRPMAGIRIIPGVESGTGKPITLSLPANLPNKGISIFQQFPTRTPKTVTIVPSLANARIVVGGTVTGLKTVQGTKLVMLPAKKNVVNLLTSTGQKSTTVQTIQQATVQQSLNEPATTDASEAESTSQQQQTSNKIQKSVEDSDTSLNELEQPLDKNENM